MNTFEHTRMSGYGWHSSELTITFPHCSGPYNSFNSLRRFNDDMQRFFLPNWLKVVSSCLLHYKPVYVTNFAKLRRKMLKKYKFIGLFCYSYSLAISFMCDVMAGYACFLCVVRRLRLDKKLFIIPFYVLRTYFYVVMPICCVMSHSTLQ